MDVLNKELFNELNKAMMYNQEIYIEEVINIVLEFTNPGRIENYRYYEDPIKNKRNKYQITNQTLYDALVKYNKIKGL